VGGVGGWRVDGGVHLTGWHRFDKASNAAPGAFPWPRPCVRPRCPATATATRRRPRSAAGLGPRRRVPGPSLPFPRWQRQNPHPAMTPAREPEEWEAADEPGRVVPWSRAPQSPPCHGRPWQCAGPRHQPSWHPTDMDMGPGRRPTAAAPEPAAGHGLPPPSRRRVALDDDAPPPLLPPARGAGNRCDRPQGSRGGGRGAVAGSVRGLWSGRGRKPPVLEPLGRIYDIWVDPLSAQANRRRPWDTPSKRGVRQEHFCPGAHPTHAPPAEGPTADRSPEPPRKRFHVVRRADRPDRPHAPAP